MQTLRKRTPARIENVSRRYGYQLAAVTLTGCLGLLAGCASPGAPLPPSLKLPEPPTGLTATRVGSQVLLHWTTSGRTTDRLLLTGPVTAEICREPVNPASPPPRPARAARPGTVPCNPVVRVPVSPGASDATDTLPVALTSGAPRALAYRVWLVNAAGRTAGPSAIVYAASGEAPPPVTGLRASSTKPGVVLEWDHTPTPVGIPQPGSSAQSGNTVELDRVLQSPQGSGAKTPPANPASLTTSDSSQTESRFGARDTGGAIDRTAEPGASYRYTVQRIRQVQLDGRTLEIRGEASPPVEVAVRSAFPPDMPAGLVAAPAFSTSGKPAVDLSWEPNVELHIAGYKVYRRQGSGAASQGGQAWQPVTSQPVRVAAYTDNDVAPGERYTYRVTAVSDTGLESQPSAEASQTVPAR